MNRNIRIARELVRLAKSLAAGMSYNSWDFKNKFESLMSEFAAEVAGIDGVEEANFVPSLTKEKDNGSWRSPEVYAYIRAKAFGEEFYFSIDVEIKTNPSIFTLNRVSSPDNMPEGSRIIGNKDEIKRYIHNMTEGVVYSIESHQREKRMGKRFEIGWDSRGNGREIYLNLRGVEKDEQYSIQKEVYDACKKLKGIGTIEWDNKQNMFKIFGFGGNVSSSEYSNEPFKTIISTCENLGLKMMK